MIKVTVKNNISFPDILIEQEDLETIAQDIVIADLIKGIDYSMAINGGPLPDNDPKTIKRKGSSKPLIDTGTLRRSFYQESIGKNKVIITIEPERKSIGGYLQDGIKTSHGIKQYLFFGLSKDAVDKIRNYVKKIVSERIDAKRSK